MLADSALLAPVREARARRIFRRLGEAEAHGPPGCPSNQVHFHEVGAVDAIVDIVGTAIGLHLLRVDADRLCPAAPVPRGVTRGSHGAMPLPAPATLELLRGSPVLDGRCDRELVTPTGAAIAAEVAHFGAAAGA